MTRESNDISTPPKFKQQVTIINQDKTVKFSQSPEKKTKDFVFN